MPCLSLGSKSGIPQASKPMNEERISHADDDKTQHLQFGLEPSIHSLSSGCRLPKQLDLTPQGRSAALVLRIHRLASSWKREQASLFTIALFSRLYRAICALVMCVLRKFVLTDFVQLFLYLSGSS